MARSTHSPLLGFTFRSTSTLLAGLILAAAEALALLKDGQPWIGDALWGIQRLGSPLAVVLIALAVLAALDAGSEATGVRSMFQQLPARGRWSTTLWRWAATVAPVSAVHLLACAAVVAVSAWSSHEFALPTGSIMVQVGAIAFSGALGIAAGHVAQPYLGAVIAGAAQSALVFGLSDSVFLVSAGDSPYAGLTLRPEIVWPAIAVLAVGTALLLSVSLRPSAKWPVRGAYFGGAAAAAVVVLASQTISGYAIQPSSARPDVCANSSPRVCVFGEYQRLLPQVEASIARLVRAAEKAGIEPSAFPNTILQVVPGGPTLPPETTDFLLQFDELAGRGIRPVTAAEALVVPDWCPALNSPTRPPDSYFDRQTDAMAWLVRQSGQMSDRQFGDTAPRLAAMTAREQTVAVRDTLSRFARCELR